MQFHFIFHRVDLRPRSVSSADEAANKWQQSGGARSRCRLHPSQSRRRLARSRAESENGARLPWMPVVFLPRLRVRGGSKGGGGYTGRDWLWWLAQVGAHPPSRFFAHLFSKTSNANGSGTSSRSFGTKRHHADNDATFPARPPLPPPLGRSCASRTNLDHLISPVCHASSDEC